ncbi:hypothetical protein [Yoonia sp. SS1-5]|uniref:Uncharacterized protein n=1 Tax=Yoonia rhodophyticola TaxID=3137370 RepID=A0AAN0MMC5_9RHOB
MRYVIILLFGFAACTNAPVLDDAISDAARAAPYPALKPLPPLLAGKPSTIADDPLTARIAALNARAARLRAAEIGALQ